MSNYRNKKCVVCNEFFSEYDDVVVCPECGAPYHRKCYELENKCIYESVHGTDESYHDDEFHQEADVAEKKSCPHCNFINSKEADFCVKCGYVLKDVDDKNLYEQLQNEVPFVFDPMGGINPDENMDGIPAGEIAKFVGSNTPYYMNAFKKIKSEKKNKFNFSAFLFTGAWFLYRKQYKIGAILTSVVFLMMIVSLFIDYFYSTPILNEIFNSVGVSITSDLSSSNYLQLYGEFTKLSQDKKILLFAPAIIKLLDFLIMIFSGIFANKSYYNYCVKFIKRIKETTKSNSDYNEEIQRSGGVNLRIMWAIFFCYMIITFLPSIVVPN